MTQWKAVAASLAVMRLAPHTVPPAVWQGHWTAHSICTVSFSKDVFSQGAEYEVFLGVFLMFSAFFYSKIWAKFHFGTFKPSDYEKI